MWIFTKYGFFSAVCARKGFGSWKDPVDPDRMMIRGRSQEHLEHLVARFPNLATPSVESFEHSDYPYRVFVSKEEWVAMMSELASEIRYDNFKRVVSTELPSDALYRNALHEVWAVMISLEGD